MTKNKPTADNDVNKEKLEIALVVLTVLGFAVAYGFPQTSIYPLLLVSFLAAAPTFVEAWQGIKRFKITIDVFNSFAVLVSYAVGEFPSAAFIGLMLAFARLLEHRTSRRMHRAVQELLKLKPSTALVEMKSGLREIAADKVKKGDVVIIKSGDRVPVDGSIIFGRGSANEASVTGESLPVDKVIGDKLLSSTLLESGSVKMRAERVGKDSTIERIAALVRSAAEHKSPTEKMADRFAGFFLPLVAALGLGTWALTGDATKMTAIFLVACADDLAVAIPLAVTASLGMAARKGVLIKGGEYLQALHDLKILLLDKTGTLTFGKLDISAAHIEPGVSEEDFWYKVAIAEKFSEHSVGKAVYRQAAGKFESIPDPENFEVAKGAGVRVTHSGQEIILGSEKILEEFELALPEKQAKAIQERDNGHQKTNFFVFFDRKFSGSVTVSDIPRPEAATSLRRLEDLGVRRIVMLTGDNEATAKSIARELKIKEYHASMTPEEKLKFIDGINDQGAVGMVGDGINDAPALARTNVGIAMGGTATAVAVEAADVVILTDELSRIPDMVDLSRRTISVVKIDILIWAISNIIGFALVLTGIAGPALAAFYNFATDFLPILNSTRLFRRKSDFVTQTK
ncbi:MAG: cation-translocating P-type ATPase [Patescibacteria group bacterium]|nr:cation-translocating P-type ATPase [Patescibacteria group bacterium]